MTNAQRKVVQVVGIVLAPVFFLVGAYHDNGLLMLVAPVVSVGVGAFVWAGRDKE